MKSIKIADSTLCRESGAFSFREKLEIARQLEKLGVDAIDLPAICDERTDILFVRTAASFIKSSVISVGAGMTAESVAQAATALAGATHPRIRIELPMSPVGMEYTCHKKPPKMIEWIATVVSDARARCADVEFCAVDATRAEPEFLREALSTAVSAGATSITLCDSAAEMLPDDFAAFVSETVALLPVPVGVSCADKNGLAVASAILSVRAGAGSVKVCVDGPVVPLAVFCTMLRNCGNHYGLSFGLRATELGRIVKQILRIAEHAQIEKTTVRSGSAEEDVIRLDQKDTADAVNAAVVRLGYDLSDEDQRRVYEEFRRVSGKKKVGYRELEAIVASVALQVPPTYQLISYVINSGNIISTSAQITLGREKAELRGICLGDGPIDAAFLAIEQIIGHHYELDDFQIQSVTEGKGAMGSAVVRLRSGGKLYSGRGISTDIIDASIRAYINAINKIVYEEA